ncbi:MAG: ABC transporter ATP-binding protein [Clostridia bacterium]|nr:ABC transporter ATP-binding protein [Clostridia bacterium]
MSDILTVTNLEKYFGSKGNVTKALDGISFSVGKGEFTGIMGPSGSGKSTLLNCIATIDTVTSGQIVVGGEHITTMKSQQLAEFRRDKLGFIFQDFNLLDTLTAFENIALSLSIQNRPPRQIKTLVQEIARQLNITQELYRYPYQMSGGQKQRVAAARAIVTDPHLILADEPTGALDSKSARMLLDALTAMNRDLEATILMVTHDAFTASYCHRILFIKDGRLFTELQRGADSRKQFFDRIIDVVTLLGGDDADVI